MRFFIGVAFWGLMGASNAMAQGSSIPAPLLMQPLEDRVEKNEIQVFGGTGPVAGNWSSVFVAHLEGKDGLRSCTATLVGPRALLTAAHCVDAGDKVPLRTLQLAIGKDLLAFTCKIDPRYQLAGGYRSRWPRANGALDFALCALQERAAPLPERFHNFLRERISLSPIATQESVLLTGYGCTEMAVDLLAPSLASGPFSSVFTIGEEKVETASAELMTTLSVDAKEPALCDGDSGGPVFTGVRLADVAAPRQVRAVNSKVSVETYELVSTMALLSSDAFRQFLGCWIKEVGAPVFVVEPQLVRPCAA